MFLVTKIQLCNNLFLIGFGIFHIIHVMCSYRFNLVFSIWLFPRSYGLHVLQPCDWCWFQGHVCLFPYKLLASDGFLSRTLPFELSIFLSLGAIKFTCFHEVVMSDHLEHTFCSARE